VADKARPNFKKADLVCSLRQDRIDLVQDAKEVPRPDATGELICECIDTDTLIGISEMLEEQRASIAVVAHVNDLLPTDSENAGRQAAVGTIILEGEWAIVGEDRTKCLREALAHPTPRAHVPNKW